VDKDEDLIASGFIDPIKVVRGVVERATSVAKPPAHDRVSKQLGSLRLPRLGQRARTPKCR
jgi:hypothetical protein